MCIDCEHKHTRRHGCPERVTLLCRAYGLRPCKTPSDATVICGGGKYKVKGSPIAASNPNPPPYPMPPFITPVDGGAS